MYDGENTETGSVRTPPYISFQTFLTLIEDLKTNGLPPRIDRSVLKRFSGGVGGQLQVALKSLGLSDETNVPTDRLARMVETFGTEAFKSVLRESLAYGYPFLANFDLKNGTPSMFVEAFRKATSAREDVLQKCRRFYIYAAQFCGVEIGPRLTAGAASQSARTTGAGAGYKRRATKRTSDAATTEAVHANMHRPAAVGNEGFGGAHPLTSDRFSDADAMAMLIAKMDMAKMTDEEQSAVWTLLRYLKRREAEARAGGGADA